MFFRIKGIYISISYYFFVMLAWIIITGKINTFLICFSALLLHELGHIIAIRILNEKINIFYILPFGFCCKLKNKNKIQDKNIIKILFAGPVTSILVAGFVVFWTRRFAIVNVIVGIFNLLPIGNLDGAQIFNFFAKKYKV